MKNAANKYFCYSPALRKYLDQNGTRWIDKGVNGNTGSPYWVFQQSTRLGELLKKYNVESQK